jgi:hypothetical protein
MQANTSPPTVKVVGANGQISLGKQFAGRQVLVEEKETGVWRPTWHVRWNGQSNTLHLTFRLMPF